MKKYLVILLFFCFPAIAEDSVFNTGQQSSLVTRIKLEAAKTTAGYVISGTMFYEIIAELQAVQERIKAKDEDVEILRYQCKQLDTVLTIERQAKDSLIQERVAVVLEKENLLLEGALTPEEKATIENVIKTVIKDKAVPIVKEIEPTPTPGELPTPSPTPDDIIKPTPTPKSATIIIDPTAITPLEFNKVELIK